MDAREPWLVCSFSAVVTHTKIWKSIEVKIDEKHTSERKSLHLVSFNQILDLVNFHQISDLVNFHQILDLVNFHQILDFVSFYKIWDLAIFSENSGLVFFFSCRLHTHAHTHTHTPYFNTGSEICCFYKGCLGLSSFHEILDFVVFQKMWDFAVFAHTHTHTHTQRYYTVHTWISWYKGQIS